jgi:hypothetical protein
MLIAEFIGVAISWVAKWYKSGCNNNSRLIGFTLSIAVSLFWAVYFFLSDMPWLTLNSLGVIGMAVRGILNNKSDAE